MADLFMWGFILTSLDQKELNGSDDEFFSRTWR